ncbi:MAG TPA: hypothetical protein VN636_02035, partial [Acidimicrobiia bacterium]|nr:hypothetical protein [Acidimicrobiia bacterium]
GFAKGCGAAGTGVTLPPVAVSPYATRAADQVAFASLAGATVSAPGATGVTVPASPLVLDAVPHGAPATRTQLTATKHGGSDLFRTRDVVIVLILLVAAAVVLRRRAVKRRRRIRITRRRQRAAAMRSGGLPVVDGRYRTGTRVGPPVESHVRVRRGS